MSGLTDQPPAPRRRIAAYMVAAGLALVLLPLLPSLIKWRSAEDNRAEGLSNLRRLANALQLYSQDYDGCLMMPVTPVKNGPCLSWPDRLKGYIALHTILDAPSNPLKSAPHTPLDPLYGCPITTGYALNRRFYGVFSSGPFPLDNLELPAQTVLLVQAGPMWAVTGRSADDQPTPHSFADLFYGDTTDRYNGLVPYPSANSGELEVAAADGHAACLRVAHYSKKDGPHDTLYGRIGEAIYNWNGGHPNGETDRPPHE